MGKKKGNSSKQGSSALSKIIKTSTDQAVGFVKSRYGGKQAAVNIAKDLNSLRKLLNVEQKEVTSSQTTASVSSAASQVIWLGSPGQGASGSQRDGDSIKVTRIDANLMFFWGTGTSNITSNQVFNYYIVRYNKTPSSGGSSSFAIGDFLALDQNGQVTPCSLPSNDLAQNFTVLHSGTISVSPGIATATNNVAYEVVPISVECSFHQTFTGSAASTICDNAVFMVFTGMQPTNTGGTSGIQYNARLWYVDN